MKIAVLVEDYYQVLEVWYPYLRLKEAGIETIFLGPGRKKEYLSKEGYPVAEDVSVCGVNSNDFGGVIIPGGYAPDYLRRSKEIISFVRKINSRGKLVAAICHGGWVLVSAKVLAGRKVTCFSAIKDDIVNAKAEFVDQDVVVDDNLITSRKPEDLPVFCREILRFLKLKN
ncbi:MAG: type 1 glutamine amidotransferase [Candidatus Omnitrophica bacterium]|nr:type 1 glutamine amidotransferase [Candidatus Omnitrophota bacterium]